MKKLVLINIITLLSASFCAAQVDEDGFSSKIAPDNTLLKPGEKYTNVLKFIEFDDNYDYAYSVFETEAGDTVTLYHNDPIDGKYKGQLLEVTWEIGTYYEAGESEKEYYHEHLISFEVK
ncbi:MAG: hypothetical protein L3J35_06370 [Bacteroidales bacterium]|nr:hypothetical protein [Bacteroidales bacterium]